MKQGSVTCKSQRSARKLYGRLVGERVSFEEELAEEYTDHIERKFTSFYKIVFGIQYELIEKDNIYMFLSEWIILNYIYSEKFVESQLDLYNSVKYSTLSMFENVQKLKDIYITIDRSPFKNDWYNQRERTFKTSKTFSKLKFKDYKDVHFTYF